MSFLCGVIQLKFSLSSFFLYWPYELWSRLNKEKRGLYWWVAAEVSSPPADSWSSSLTWGCGGKYIWLRSEVLSAQCLMTAFIFWAWRLCCSCLTMCTCPVFCSVIDTLVHASAARCVAAHMLINSSSSVSLSVKLLTVQLLRGHFPILHHAPRAI